MSRLLNATVVHDDALFASIEGEEKTITFEYKINTPFTVDKEHKPEHDDNDVVVYGPVYVGDEKMLDRHKELVSPEAIMESWDSYEKNPVILYNHRKDYGVIGRMETVEMGDYEKPDGTKIAAVFGRAIIDGGEENITRKIRKGMLKAFSIGFIAKAAIKEGRGQDAYLKFTNIEWIETSVVDIPASPNALFNVSKSVVEYDGEKHILAVEERDDSYVIEFAKPHDMPEDDSPQEGTELSYSADDMVELVDTIAGLEAKMSELETRIGEPIGGDTVKTHDDSQQAMTETELAAEELVEEVVEETPTELSAPEETFTVKAEEVVEEEATEEVVEEEEVLEEATEEEELVEAVEEAVEEVLEEVLEEELVEEVAEATEEESAEVPVETKEETTEDVEGAVLSEVVIALSAVETGLSNLIARLDETESLKALLAEKDAEISSLSETIDANAKQAEFDAAVDAKVAEKLSEVGVAPATASPKSLSPAKPHGDILTDVTTHDKGASPQVSKGMAHLGAWLEGRLGGRRTE